MNKKTMMTEGSIWKHLILFSIPLILGNLFQQLYNTVDSIIVGKYVGREALAAVGSGGSVINLLVGFLVGTSMGAGVVTAQYYGAGDKKRIHQSVHTTIALSFISGAVLLVMGIILTPWILKMLGTPAEVFPDAVMYLRIFFGGMIFNVAYNMAAGILNAVGNSKRSLMYLVVAAITNIALDLVFVVGLNMGVAGVALATDIGQFVSFILIMRFLIRSQDSYRVEIREIKLHKLLLVKIIKMGIPTGLQNTLISFSNVIVQSSVNSFGTNAMAGHAAYVKIDGFNILPVSSFCMAATTFVGQNIGAGKYDRVRKGTKTAVMIGIIYALCTGGILLAIDTQLLSVFTDNEEVIGYGVQMMWYFCPFYFLLSILHVIGGAIRGAGKTMESMLICLISMCVLRIVWIQVMLSVSHEIQWVFMAYPVTWLAGATMMVLYALKGNWIPRNKEEVQHMKI